MRKLLFVINPIAGGVDKSIFKAKLEAFVARHHLEHHTYFTTGKDDEANIRDLLQIHEPSMAVAVGGDGTLLMVAKCILHSSVTLGIIPYGSANGMAAELQIPNDKQEALETLLNGKEIVIDTLLIDKQYPCLHIGDVGFNAKIVKRFEEDKQRGLLGYAKHFFREFRFSQRMKSIVITDKNKQKVKCHMIAFANARKYGTGALLNPIGKLDDGFFELCIIKTISFRVFLLVLATFFSGTVYKTKFAKIIRCSKAQIKLKRNKTMTVQIDGEIIGERNKLDIEIISRSLRVRVPAVTSPKFTDYLVADINYEDG